MDATRYILRNITVLNILLAAAVIFMVLNALLPQLHIELRALVPALKKTRDVGIKETAPAANVVHSLSDYLSVSEENPFHPDRKIPPEKKAEDKPLPKPEFVLYGTVVADNVRIAFLEDLKSPRNSTGRGKRQTTVRQGDVFSGFTLKEVGNETAVMVRGEERLTIKVHRSGSGKDPTTGDTTANARRAATNIPQKPSFPAERAPMTTTDEKVRSFFTK